MSKVERFEDLIAWQKARELTKAIYSVTADGRFSKDFGLRDQIRRASVSIMSNINIAEGFGRGSMNEFHQFLVVSKASCAEVQSQLYIALDVGYLDKTTFKKLSDSANEVARIISALRTSVCKQRK